MCLGLANGGYIPPKEEKKTVSLLKRKTNFENLTPAKLAEIMRDIGNESKYCCEYCNFFNTNKCDINSTNCMKGITKYLESEAEQWG